MESRRTLAQPSARFAGDDGSPDPITRQLITNATDQISYARALVGLCTSRLLLPVVASGDDTPHQDPERHAELAAVTLQTQAGNHLLAFTGLDSLQAWRPDARPVLCTLDEVAATVEPAGAGRILLDAAGPVPFVIAGDELKALAGGARLVEFAGGEFAWVSNEEN